MHRQICKNEKEFINALTQRLSMWISSFSRGFYYCNLKQVILILPLFAVLQTYWFCLFVCLFCS